MDFSSFSLLIIDHGLISQDPCIVRVPLFSNGTDDEPAGRCRSVFLNKSEPSLSITLPFAAVPPMSNKFCISTCFPGGIDNTRKIPEAWMVMFELVEGIHFHDPSATNGPVVMSIV